VLKVLHFISNDYWLFVEVRNLINQIYGMGFLRNWQLLGWLRNSPILVKPDGSQEPTNKPVGITHSYTLIMEAVFSKTTLDLHRAIQRTHHKTQ